MANLLRALGLMVVLTGLASAADWPAWRGATGQGHSNEKDVPVKWSATENVRWKAPLPDEGNSTPIVWNDRVFITQASEKKDWPPKPGAGGPASAYKRSLVCLARDTGKILWQRDVFYKEKESTHPTNPFCSASPATDGDRVVVSHGSAGMYCYDLEGKELWKKDLGKLEHVWGNASSPIFFENLVILWCGPGDRQFLLAVNKYDGGTVWERQIPGGDYGADKGNWLGSWSTPILVRVEDRDEMILGVPEKLKAFEPKTGKEIWSCDGLGKLMYTSAVYSEKHGIAVAFAGYGGAAIAVKTGGKGDVTKTHRLWQLQKGNPQRIGSPVVIGDNVYLVNENGVAHCFDIQTGKDLWKQERVSSQSWGSLVAAAGRLYVTNMAGETVILAADPKHEVIGKNPLGERVLASIAISDGDLFIRSYKHLWCINQKK